MARGGAGGGRTALLRVQVERRQVLGGGHDGDLGVALRIHQAEWSVGARRRQVFWEKATHEEDAGEVKLEHDLLMASIRGTRMSVHAFIV
jgi:hypothetical protein